LISQIEVALWLFRLSEYRQKKWYALGFSKRPR